MLNLHSQYYRIKFKTGLGADINSAATLAQAVEGEPHWCTDTNRLYIFDGTQNLGVAMLNTSDKVVQNPASASATPAASAIPIADSSGKLDAWLSPASDSTPGKVELSTAAETSAGTDATRAVSPDSLSGSDFGKRLAQVLLTDNNTAPTVTDCLGDLYFTIPAELNGYNLVGAHACLASPSTSGALSLQVHNQTDAADMLSTPISIDANETTSYTAATPPVIDSGHDDLATGDQLRFDCDASGTGAQGLTILLSFQLP